MFREYLQESKDDFKKVGNQVIPTAGWYIKQGRKTSYINDYILVRNITELKEYLKDNFETYNPNELAELIYTKTNDIYDIVYEFDSYGKKIFTIMSVPLSKSILTNYRYE